MDGRVLSGGGPKAIVRVPAPEWRVNLSITTSFELDEMTYQRICTDLQPERAPHRIGGTWENA
jgi:hypothetical protein